MRVMLKDRLLIVAPDTAEETEQCAAWRTAMAGQVFSLQAKPGTGMALRAIGPEEEACRIPINVWSGCTHPGGRWISNFADTPFVLDGRSYRTVEGFWQGLKFTDESDRERIAQLPGLQARKVGQARSYGATVTYDGCSVAVGTWDHWALMERACRAKFEQHEEARKALLSTGTRPLEHRMRRDSRQIPGAIMAEIWMRIRRELQES